MYLNALKRDYDASNIQFHHGQADQRSFAAHLLDADYRDDYCYSFNIVQFRMLLSKVNAGLLARWRVVQTTADAIATDWVPSYAVA